MSGTALANWSFAADPVTKAEYLLQQLNCSITNTTAAMECLQNISDWRVIRDVNMSDFQADFSPIWGPVLDGVLLDRDPVNGSPLNTMLEGEYLNYEVRNMSSNHVEINLFSIFDLFWRGATLK